MNIGIIGLSSSGKSTLFASFTGKKAESSGRGASGIVSIPDERLDKISKFFNPKKTTYATVVFEDEPSLDTSKKKDRIKLEDRIQKMDALIMAVGAYRCLDTEEVVREALKARFEMVVNDLDFVIKRMERLQRDIRIIKKDRLIKETEMNLLKRLQVCLEEERFLAGMDFTETETTIMKNYNLSTLKPLSYLINLSEETDDENAEIMVREVRKALEETGDTPIVMSLYALLESELAAMEPDDAREFMKEFGIENLGRERVIHAVYNIMERLTFFTVVNKECRSWNIKKGGTALDAAGAIHTDIARGFIRAEVVDYKILLQLGSENEVKKAGKLRLEGKTYQVKDGEVINIMFNI